MRPKKTLWKASLEELLQARADLWLVLVDTGQWAKPSVRYALSLFATMLAARRGGGFPIVLLDPGSGLVVPDALAQASVLRLS